MNKIVSKEQWMDARKQLLVKEKELTRMRDELAKARQTLPWNIVENNYIFTGPEGTSSLSELFADKSQLVVYHFMYAPGWEEGCKSCSFWADQYDTINLHIGQRDVSLVVISRALLEDFQAFKARMGWKFNWLSSAGNTFNKDFNVSFPDQQEGVYNYHETRVMEEMPGLSVFYKKEDGNIYHTYSCYSRGLDALNSTYQMLDLLPRGRDEAGLEYSMAWLNHHDKY